MSCQHFPFHDYLSRRADDRLDGALRHHFSAYAQGAEVNPHTLLSHVFLGQYALLIMLLEAFPAAPMAFAIDLFSWRPKSYAEQLAASAFRHKAFAIAAYDHAPHSVRRRFERAVADLDDTALTVVASVRTALERGRAHEVPRLCHSGANVLRDLHRAVAAIINQRGDERPSASAAVGAAGG